MKNLSLGFLCILIYSTISAQEKLPLALAIIAEPRETSDGISLSIHKPALYHLIEGQGFICKGLYRTSDADTASRGYGTITAIYSDYIECLIKKKNILVAPQKDDLCFFIVEALSDRKDVFYKLARFNISFHSVLDSLIFDAEKSSGEWNENKTNTVLKELTKDIQFTGKEMQAQNNSQDQTIKEGDFSGKQLFAAMQQVKETDVLDFLKYVQARPIKYMGHVWKISETFATWMINGTPKAVGEIE